MRMIDDVRGRARIEIEPDRNCDFRQFALGMERHAILLAGCWACGDFCLLQADIGGFGHHHLSIVGDIAMVGAAGRVSQGLGRSVISGARAA